jgi:hypothetical protein
MRQGRLEAFLSYASKDRALAKRLKKQLEHLSGIGVFVAPEDIRPSRIEWRKRIVKRVKECDIFLALLTRYYRRSEWTDQETGMAIAQSKLIIPLKVGKSKPHGFLESYQWLTLSPRFLGKGCSDILTIIKDDSRLKDRIKWSFITCFRESRNFDEANDRSELLETLGPYDGEQVNYLFSAYLEKPDIHHGYSASRILVDLLIRDRKLVKSAMIRKAREVSKSTRRSDFLHLDRLLTAF